MSTLDRDAAREVLLKAYPTSTFDADERVLDALEACVRPAPAHTIDRATFVQQYELLPGSDGGPDSETVADIASETAWPDDDMQRQIDELMAALALLRPVKGGVVLTREEAARVAEWLEVSLAREDPVCRALADHLRIAS